MTNNDEPLPALPPAVTKKGFKLTERVSSGGFSVVYKASWTEKPGVEIAVKIINLANVDQTWVLKNLKNEMKIMKKLNHQNVIHLYDMVKTSTCAYIFMEFAKNGSVDEVMNREKRPLTEGRAKKYAKDIIRGLAYIHGEGVAHRDIKPDNFLIDHTDKAMLSDFGFACISLTKSETKLMKGTSCGTSEYMAVELKTKREGEVYDAKAADMYSLGVSLYYMIYFDHPFDSSNDLDCIRKQKNKEFRFKSFPKISDELKNLIDRCLDPNPKTRITSSAAFRHPWFTSN